MGTRSNIQAGGRITAELVNETSTFNTEVYWTDLIYSQRTELGMMTLVPASFNTAKVRTGARACVMMSHHNVRVSRHEMNETIREGSLVITSKYMGDPCSVPYMLWVLHVL